MDFRTEIRIPTEKSEKFLAVHFESSGSWKLHYAKKLAAGTLTRMELRKAGLLGGANAPAASLLVVKAVVWPKVDYARPATDISGAGYALLRKKMDAFTTSTLRWALGASPQSMGGGPDDKKCAFRLLMDIRWRKNFFFPPLPIQYNGFL